MPAQAVYGTLENVLLPQDQDGENGAKVIDGNIIGLSKEGQDKNKRIYSHCHVQQREDRPTNPDVGARRRLIVASVICLLFMIGEIVGGVLSNSLAIATDAAHLLSDFASFMISLFAIWLASRPATRKMSFGWYRAEVIGALVSVLVIWLVTGLLVYMAIERLKTEEFEIDSLVMVVTASLGLLVNIIMALALSVDGHGHLHGHHHGSHQNHNHGEEHDTASILPNANCSELSETRNTSTSGYQPDRCQPEIQGRGKSNINVRAAFIHVIGDFLQSLGVLIAALVVHFEPSYAIVDPICTFLFSFLVLITTIKIIRDATNVLMEGIPDGINFHEVIDKLKQLPGVIKVHNLRIWSLSMDKIAISSHLVIDSSRTPSQALKSAIDTLKSSYNFLEITIQVEEFKDDMLDCEHCRDEEFNVDIENDSKRPQLSQATRPSSILPI